jgi:hypothetical protein
MNRSGLPALAGLLAVASGAAAAELVAALLGRPQAGTVVAVGAVLVDAAPTPVKEFAVATLGTADKPVLLGGIAVVLAVLAAGLGVVAFRNRVGGLAGVAVLGLVGTGAALTRPAAELVDALPSLVGGLVIAGVLLLLLRALRPAASALRPAGSERTRRSVDLTYPTPRSLTPSRDLLAPGVPGDRAAPPDEPAGVAVDRRAFLGAAALVAVGAAATGGVAALLGRSATSTRVRESVRLPAPTEPAPPLPAGLEPGFVTANADFYRVDTALTVPARRPRLLAAHDRRDGRLARRAVVRRAARPPARRARRHPELRVERGRRPLHRHRPLARRPAGAAAARGRCPAGADQLLARSVDGMTIGSPMAALFDGREPLLCVG